MNTLKIAYIGMGYRGKQLLALTRHIPYFQVTAIADPEAREADYDVPCYNQGGDDYQRMITLHAPQLVFIPGLPYTCEEVTVTTCAIFYWTTRVIWATGKRRKASGEANSTSRKMAIFILLTDWLLSASSPAFPAKTVLYA